MARVMFFYQTLGVNVTEVKESYLIFTNFSHIFYMKQLRTCNLAVIENFVAAQNHLLWHWADLMWIKAKMMHIV